MRVKTEMNGKTKTLYDQEGVAGSATTEGNLFALEEIAGTMMIGDAMIVKIVMIAVAEIAETEMTDAADQAETGTIGESGRAHGLVTAEEAIDHAAAVERGEIGIVNESVQPVHCPGIQAHWNNGNKPK